MITDVGSTTRQKLVDAATRVFAEDGAANASLLEIARRSGQRNRGAVHYHFGSREGLLVAVLAQYAGVLHERHEASLGELDEDADLPAVVTAQVAPVVGLADDGWRGRCFLVVADDLTGRDPATLDPQVVAVLDDLGGRTVYPELQSRLPDLPPRIASERLGLFTTFVVSAVAHRARALDRGDDPSPLDTDAFTANLVTMAVGMLCAPGR